MGKDYKKNDSMNEDAPFTKSENEIVSSDKVPAIKEELAMLVSFDRWFSTTGKPDHWKAGMHRFALTSGKKSLAAWAKLFENY